MGKREGQADLAGVCLLLFLWVEYVTIDTVGCVTKYSQGCIECACLKYGGQVLGSWVDGCVSRGQMSGGTDGWVDGWMHAWIDRWVVSG